MGIISTISHPTDYADPQKMIYTFHEIMLKFTTV